MVEGIKEYLKTPEWRQQHGWRKAIWRTMSRVGLTGVHALPLNRRWIEIKHLKMPMHGLDPALEGLRIVQLSDLHYSPVVWARYLRQYILWVNELQPDLIVITGDLITGGYPYATRVAKLLSHLTAKHGVVCTLGNHDYSIYGKNRSAEGKRRADYLTDQLRKYGLIVLRNEVLTVAPDDCRKPLTVVGLDDEWSGHIDPKLAWASVPPDASVLCLNHNPVNTVELMRYHWEWMLSGHTHGRQVATSRIGRTLYPKRYRHYTRGYYHVHGRHLYVNRGVSYGQRVRDWCRPEITVFRLTSATPVEAPEPVAATA